MGVIPDEHLIKERFSLPGRGGYIEIHDDRFLPTFLEIDRKIRQESEYFHKTLLDKGVKAYRGNDGWVDIKNLKITFFPDDSEKGYYWHPQECLKSGDLIFIGWKDNGGRFARIKDVGKKFECGGGWSQSYTYVPLVETLDGTVRQYITENNLTKWQKILLLFGMFDESRIATDICHFKPTEHI